MNRTTVLITGISGFIARHCAVELLNAGYGVRGTVRSLRRAAEVRDSIAKHTDVAALEFAEADLESDAGWPEAVAGCAHVLHVASPFPAKQPRDAQQLIRPAVEGTLRVLRASAAAGVERLVQTSSMVAVMYGHPRERTAAFAEADWTRVEDPGVTPYAKSKTLAERAAREFAAQDRSGMHYSSVNPGLVLGPALDRDIGTSAEIIQMFLRGKYPGAPRRGGSSVGRSLPRRCGLPVADRDCACHPRGPRAGRAPGAEPRAAGLGRQARRAVRPGGAALGARTRQATARGHRPHAPHAWHGIHPGARGGRGHGAQPRRAEAGLMRDPGS